MKRSLLLCVSVFVLGVFCFLPGNALAYDEKNPLVLKAAIDSPKGDIKAEAIRRLGDLVEQRTNGRVRFQYFYGASLIPRPQFFDGVSRGIADISLGPGGFVSGKIPALLPFEVFGAINFNRFHEIQRAIEPAMIRLFEPRNVRPIMMLYNPHTVFAHRTRFLRSPEDWKGQKMRMSGRLQSALAGRWGASPIFLPPGELYLALQRGTIDGYQLIVDIVYGFRLYEVSPFLTLPSFSNNIEFVTMNLAKWNALTEVDRAAFQRSIDDVEAWMVPAFRTEMKNLKSRMAAKGAKIQYTTEEEDALYVKEAATQWPEVRKLAGPIGNEFIDILERYRR